MIIEDLYNRKSIEIERVTVMKKYLEANEVFMDIYIASDLKNLGLFVGAGFTKAIFEGSRIYSTYSWIELLNKCAEEMEIDFNDTKKNATCPEIATQICKLHSIEKKIEYDESVAILKNTVTNLTNVFLDENELLEFKDYFEELNVNWIVTTNYDTILESIFFGKCYILKPEDSFSKIKDLIPIYHIHGVRTSPDNIVITNEDYVSLFRPTDYRKARLPFLIKESTVLMLGYGLGDLNVVSALDWSENVYKNSCEHSETKIIQLLYVEKPSKRPYVDSSGIIIFETNSIRDFLLDLNSFILEYEKDNKAELQRLNGNREFFSVSDESAVQQFIDDREFRFEIINFIAELKIELSDIYPLYLGFLRKVIQKLDKDASIPNAFSAYGKKILILIELLNKIDIKKASPVFFSFIVDELDKVGHYVGYEHGDSWAAKKKWEEMKTTINEDTKNEIMKYVKSKRGCFGIKKLFELDMYEK